MDTPKKDNLWTRLCNRYRKYKEDKDFQRRYEKKLKEIKKKDPYTYD